MENAGMGGTGSAQYDAVLKAVQETLECSVTWSDHFFDMGGDSIKAVQLTMTIKQELSIDISLESIFKFPVVREFADACVELLNQSSAEQHPEVPKEKEVN